MNYIFNKTVSITLIAIAITSGVSLTEKIASASPENSTETNLDINKTRIAQASEPIETQPGPHGWNVQLTSSKVNSIEEVSYIDDNTAQLYGVLKDESESYLFSAKYINGEQFGIPVDETTPVWFKFPAPSPETQTISINIPGVGPFVEVPLQR